jgi:hypothetical protein
MENSTHSSGLRYLDADDVDDAVVDFDGLNVYGSDGHKVGDVDGFIIDAGARRVKYVVVDSGGWFSSRRLLLPIGHAALAPDRKSLQVDMTRKALERLPPFHHEEFGTLRDDALFAFERDTTIACCPDEPLEDIATAPASPNARRHFDPPEWWSSARYAPERLRPIDEQMFSSRTPIAVSGSSTTYAKTRDEHDRDLVTARGDESATRAGDVSPHLGGRAQPGDVLGIETGGETTGIGDTDEDENTRRRTAERAAANSRRDTKRGKR